jgi:hypothetical protein
MRFIRDRVGVPISSDIANEISRYDPVTARRLRRQKIVNTDLFIVFQKHEDIPFVPPIDAHAGGVVDDQRIRSRYWTVFGGERPPG